MRLADRSSAAYQFFDFKPPPTDMLREVLAGLSSQPKFIAPKYFYDERGSRLFEAITRLPEYYLTRTEMAILDRCLPELRDAIGKGVCLVEYGAGSSLKIRRLLETLRPEAYMPVDISHRHLKRTAAELHADHPWLRVYPTCADLTAPLALPGIVASYRKVGFFPGSSIGNFEPHAAQQFLGNVARGLGAGAHLLIGIDRKKDKRLLEAAYNDAAGVTSEFNLNVLWHLNDALAADFNLDAFRHLAIYNERAGCIQMFLESLAEQRVRLNGTAIRFGRGETVHTENSYKYDLDEFLGLAAASGFGCRATWTDPDNYFSLILLRIFQIPRRRGRASRSSAAEL